MKALLDEAVDLLKTLGLCPTCGGHYEYCANCRGHGAKGCSCDRAGSWSPRPCRTCVRGQPYIKPVRLFLNKLKRAVDVERDQEGS